MIAQLRTSLVGNLAGLLAVIGAALIALLIPTDYADARFLLFLIAVALTARYAGASAAFFALLLSLFAFVLLLPRDEPFEPTVLNVLRLLLFAIASGIALVFAQKPAPPVVHNPLSGDQFATILRSVADGITVQGTSGEVIFANDVAARLTGFSSVEELVSTPVAQVVQRFTLMDAAGQPFPLERMPGRLALQGVEGAEALVRFRVNATGAERWSIVRSTPVFDDATGGVCFAINVFQDVTDLMLSDQKLYQERERYRVTLAGIGDGVIATDLDGRITFLNTVAELLTGWHESDALGQPMNAVVTFIAEDTRETLANPIVAALENGTPTVLRHDAILLAKNGVEHPIADSAAPIRDGEGTVIGAVLVFRDVTEQRKTERALAQLAAIVTYSSDAIIATTLDGTITSWNAAAQRIFGYTASEAVGMSVLMLSPEDKTDEIPLMLEGIARGEAVDHFETTRVTRDGTRKVVSLSVAPLKNERGDIVGAAIIARDVSERRKIEDTLEHERTIMRLLIDNLPDFVYVKDTEGRFLMNNLVHAMIMKARTVDETIGRTDFDFFPSELAQRYFDDEQEIIRTGQAKVNFEEPSVKEDGTPIVALTTKMPLRGTDGTIIGIVGITRDITERKRIDRERELLLRKLAELLKREQAARAQAEEANDLKLQFLAMISHELRTPLTSIKGFISTLLAEDVTWDVEQRREFLNIADDEADKLRWLVEQLLEVSRLQAGALSIQVEPMPFQRILDVAMAQLQTITRNNTLVLDIAPGLPAVVADAQRVAQVIVNLVDNAVKYSPPRTTITLSASAVDQALQIDVSDEGEGIAPEDRAHVFEAFRQADKKLRRKGAGLGLAICEGLVRAHGGRIWIQDRPGPGTTISFTLPAAEAP